MLAHSMLQRKIRRRARPACALNGNRRKVSAPKIGADRERDAMVGQNVYFFGNLPI